MVTNIPTPEEISRAYMSYTEAASRLGVEVDTNVAHSLKKLGLTLVRIATKPVVYRHEVEALERKQARDRMLEGAE